MPADITARSPPAQGAYPLTTGMPEVPVPPPNPYAAASALAAAVITATDGLKYMVRPGAELRVGRDPGQCAVILNEPRISGVHATLKFDGALLWVRDEASNNGVYVSGERIPASSWVQVPGGAPLRFGPVEFSVRFEG
jgi:hypothetical protein